jgi:hypothetical protein
MSLYKNIHAKRKRIKGGSKEKMRKPGTKVYWIILLVMFFIEREVILDTLFFILGEIFKHTQ